MMSKVYNSELTDDEIKKIEKAAKSLGKYGTIEIKKNEDVIDIIVSERIRIRNGKKNYHRG